jgi:neutral ceramidase
MIQKHAPVWEGVPRVQHLGHSESHDIVKTQLTAPLSVRHQFVDMTNQSVTTDPGGNVTHTCSPAMGYSFAAGTTDGPGAFDFFQGDTSPNALWNLIVGLLKKPSEAQKECHWPKPILLDTGEIEKPYAWDPSIVDVGLIAFGTQFALPFVPGEFTTMAGRRLKATVRAALGGAVDMPVGIGGLTNTYSSYITTFEEYQGQRYEAASCIFGPHALTAYLQLYHGLGKAIKKNTQVPTGPTPPDFSDHLLELMPATLLDSFPQGVQAGDILQDADAAYACNDTVAVEFQAGCPRNDLFLGETYLAVEMQTSGGGKWETVATDASWETRFLWSRNGDKQGQNTATVEWVVPSNCKAGTYRITHSGAYKTADTAPKAVRYSGVSSEFAVSN